MQTNAFLRFIHDYSYPNDFYSFYSAEEETGLNSTGKNNNILIKDQSFYFLSGFSAKLIHKTLINSNFIQTNKLDEATLVVGSKSHEDLQKYLKVYQRMTHYLYTQVIGQKVGLHTTLTKFMYYTGLSLPFYPKTFLIPQQLEQFKKSVSSAKFWIEKPSCGSCGRGITIVEGMPEKFITRQVVMQEYIRNPLLIHGYKFDLRFYVAVTSLNPLRVYNYNDGLVRFATEKYALFFEDVSNLSAHLTNFSINKESENFQVTNDVKNDGKGSKWSHVPFWPFLDSLNFDVNNIKEKIDDAIATIIFSARNDLACQSNHRCSFELYGFDVLLTVDGEIHILEVNISPALGTSSNLDMHIKAPLVRDLFNLALIPKKSEKQMRIEAAMNHENSQQFRDRPNNVQNQHQNQTEINLHQNQADKNLHQNQTEINLHQNQTDKNQHQNQTDKNQHQNQTDKNLHQNQTDKNQHQNHTDENLHQNQTDKNQHQNQTDENQHQNQTDKNQHQNQTDKNLHQNQTDKNLHQNQTDKNLHQNQTDKNLHQNQTDKNLHQNQTDKNLHQNQTDKNQHQNQTDKNQHQNQTDKNQHQNQTDKNLHQNQTDKNQHQNHTDENLHQNQTDKNQHQNQTDENQHQNQTDKNQHQNQTDKNLHQNQTDKNQHQNQTDKNLHQNQTDKNLHQNQTDKNLHQNQTDKNLHQNQTDKNQHQNQTDKNQHQNQTDKNQHQNQTDKNLHQNQTDKNQHQNHTDENLHQNQTDKNQHQNQTDENQHQNQTDKNQHQNQTDKNLHQNQTDKNQHQNQTDKNLHQNQTDKNLHQNQTDKNLHQNQTDKNLHQNQTDKNQHQNQTDKNQHQNQTDKNLHQNQTDKNQHQNQTDKNLHQNQTDKNLHQNQTDKNLHQNQTDKNLHQNQTEIIYDPDECEHNENNKSNLNNCQSEFDSISRIIQSCPPSVLSDVASLASVCEFEFAEQRLGGFRRVYPTVERARKFDEMTAKGSMKTRLDRELEQWIQIDDDERQKFIKSKISGYRSLFGDLVEIPRGYCIVS